MGHSIGDGVIVLALAAAFLGYRYLTHRERLRRLELIHTERLAAMDKGIPLPELPIDPPPTAPPPDPNWPLIPGVVLTALGGGAMAGFSLSAWTREFWSLPLPIALVGVGFILFYLLTAERKR